MTLLLALLSALGACCVASIVMLSCRPVRWRWLSPLALELWLQRVGLPHAPAIALAAVMPQLALLALLCTVAATVSARLALGTATVLAAAACVLQLRSGLSSTGASATALAAFVLLQLAIAIFAAPPTYEGLVVCFGSLQCLS